jgi:nucleotide-binding universal stress UspA family protein
VPERACFGRGRSGYIGCRRGGPDLGILRDFERRLETVVEGFFARALPGGGVQPVELGKRMVRTMEEQKTVSVANVYVPNEFTFFLSAKDIERLKPVENALGRELAAVARRAASSENWRLLGPPNIRLIEDDSQTQGTFRVEALVVEGEDPEAEKAGPHTQLLQMASEHDAELVVMGSKRRPYPLSKDALSIGRLDACDIVLSDQGVSRKHAEIRREGDEWVVIDLGSTNGTIVNGKPVRRHRLAEGDRIEVGETTIEYHGA